MKIAVLLTNLGTPDDPSVRSVRKYLQEFLSDPRVVEIVKFIWLPILILFILPIRSIKASGLYQKIWTKEGSPLRVILSKQAYGLQKYFNSLPNNQIEIFYAMRYGNPSIEKTMQEILQKKIQKLLLFPLYPQYSATTTASTFDKVADIFKTMKLQPELRVIQSYYNDFGYIDSLCKNLRNHIEKFQPQKILFSFHGLPQKFIDQGDPYFSQCQKTVQAVKTLLNLSDDKIILSFQSRLGNALWLKPDTAEIIKKLPKENIKNISVICPGFSADCLETLEEINCRNRKIFMGAGGEQYHYITCLNDSENHIQCLAKLIQKHTVQWIERRVE